MTQKMDKDIYAQVHSFYGLDRKPLCTPTVLITDATPMVRYIAADAQHSHHLVFELAAIEYDGYKYMGRAFRCTEAELEALIKDTHDQQSVGDGVVDDEIRRVMEERLSTWQRKPDLYPEIGDMRSQNRLIFGGGGSVRIETDKIGYDEWSFHQKHLPNGEVITIDIRDPRSIVWGFVEGGELNYDDFDDYDDDDRFECVLEFDLSVLLSS